ncbi:MAG: uroporphyrinogen decarboxylase family protein [Spirochaetota bacterium]
MTGKERIVSLLQGSQPDSLPLMPITMMFASDHIGVKYGQYATDCTVMAEGQAAVAKYYDIDYVSVISDPAVEAADCGAEIRFYDNQPPAVVESNALLTDKKKLAVLKVPDPKNARRMRNRVQAVSLLKKKVGDEKLLEGWVEGPCAESADLRGINRLMMDFYDDPQFIEDIFEFVIQMELSFAKAQIEAGADIIGIGDAAASLVGPQIYEEYIFKFEKRYVEAIHAMGAYVRLHICGNITPLLSKIGELGSDILDLDSMVPVKTARGKTGPDQILLGNIDPVRVLHEGTRQVVLKKITDCFQEAGSRNYIVGAGCEVPRGTPRENMKALTGFARSNRED